VYLCSCVVRRVYMIYVSGLTDLTSVYTLPDIYTAANSQESVGRAGKFEGGGEGAIGWQAKRLLFFVLLLYIIHITYYYTTKL